MTVNKSVYFAYQYLFCAISHGKSQQQSFFIMSSVIKLCTTSYQFPALLEISLRRWFKSTCREQLSCSVQAGFYILALAKDILNLTMYINLYFVKEK